MRIEQNVQAPVFREKDIYDRLIDLEAYRNTKVLIAFFRHAGCPFCNLRVHNLSKAHAELQAAGLEMIFFFESKTQVILRSTFHRGTSPIPILSDPGKKWYDAYGLESSGMKSAVSHMTSLVQNTFKAKLLGLPVHLMAGDESIKTMPAEFLLDKDLVVKRVHYSERLNDRLDIADIQSFAKNQP